MKNAYFFALLDGATVIKNKVTLCRIYGVITRYQVYSERGGKHYNELFADIDEAIEKFMELSS
jgi:hypothetical protein